MAPVGTSHKTLTPADEKYLIEKGVTTKEIAIYKAGIKAGTINSAQAAKIQGLLMQRDVSQNPPGNQGFEDFLGSQGNYFGLGLRQTASSPFENLFNSLGSANKGIGSAIANIPKQIKESLWPSPQTPSRGPDYGGRGLADPMPSRPVPAPKVTYSDAERDANDAALDRQPGGGGVPGGGASGGAGGMPSAPPQPVFEPLPPFPDIPGLNIPQVAARDFTDQATGMYDKAYAPLYESIAGARVNTQQQGDRSDQMITGAYDKSIADIAAAAANTSGQYDQQIAGRQEAGNQLGQSVGQNYQGNNAQLAQVLGSLGIQAAAPEVLGDAANQASWQQGMVGKDTSNQTDFLTNSKNAQADYATNTQNTAQNSKLLAKGDIANQVSQQLFGLDQTKLGYDSEKAQQAIAAALGLRSEDLSLQEYNADNSVRAQEQAIKNQLDQYNAAVEASNASDADKQQAYQNSWAAYSDAVQQLQWQKTFDQNASQFATTADQSAAKILADQAAGAGGAGADGAKPPDATAFNKIREYYATTYPQDGAATVDAVYKLFQNVNNPDRPDDPKTLGQFLEKARAYAVANGLSEDAAAAAAGDIWNLMMGKGTSG